MPLLRPPAPIRDDLVDLTGPNKGKVASVSWLTWLRGISDSIAAAPEGFETVVVEGRTSAIPVTAFETDGDLSSGVYRVSWAAKVVTAAGVSSDFQVTISWTWKTVTQQWVGTLRNGNTTTTYDLSSVPLLYVDAATPVTYAVAYTSNPAAAMAFDFFGKLERLGSL